MSPAISDLLLWLVFAAMTAGAIVAVLRPLGRREGGEGEGRELALYRDQLAEIGRDLERGAIEPAEAEAARVEVSRRLLAAADAQEKRVGVARGRTVSRRLVAMLVVIGVTALSLVLYLGLGSPGLPDQPFAARMAAPVEQLPLDALVLKVETHLKEEPTDLRGWEVLAPAYVRQRRYQDAAEAWSRAIALGGETAARLAARGEAEVFAADGAVVPAARADFAKAATLDPQEPRTQYYLGIAEIEDGRKEAAMARWKALIAAAPENAPWRPSLEAELARLENPDAPGPDAAQAEAAAKLSPEVRREMIEGMVAGLAARLDRMPDDIEGWLRLVRAYGVLGRKDEAGTALLRARQIFAGDKAALARLDEAEKALPR